MIKFHLSLNVSSIPKAVAFLEKVLGVAPAKQRADYAKFELESPPLVLSLEPRSPAVHGSLNHLGFRASDSAGLVELQRRLEQAGIETQREEGVECCYARQTKFWLNDLDHRLWEFYTLDDDLEHRGAGQSLVEMVGADAATAMGDVYEPVVWEHRMHQPFTVPAVQHDEIRLRGTFNVPVTPSETRAHLHQAFTALKPGGQVMLHTLTCEEPVTGELQLPGPAAYVKHVPLRADLMAALEEAGFVDLRLTTFRSGACFEHQGIALRETQIVANRPVECSSKTCAIVFKGPFQSVTDDEGHVWRRGEPTTVSWSRWESLQHGPMADLFVLLPEVAVVSHCGI